MRQFKIKQDAVKEILKIFLIKATSYLLLTVFGAIAIIYFTTNTQEISIHKLFVILIVVAIVALVLFRAIKSQKVILNSYIIICDNNAIIREQYNSQPIFISYSDIREIIKNPNGSLIVKGNSSVNTIGIPSQLENYEKLEMLLNDIMPITVKTSNSLLHWFSYLLPILGVGLMAGVYISQDKIIVGLSGAVILIIFGLNFFEIQKIKNVNKTKKGIWGIIFLTVIIIITMYLKLTAL